MDSSDIVYFVCYEKVLFKLYVTLVKGTGLKAQVHDR